MKSRFLVIVFLSSIICMLIGCMFKQRSSFVQGTQNSIKINDVNAQKNRFSYVAAVRGAYGMILSENLYLAQKMLIRIPEEERGWTWHFLHSLSDQRIFTIESDISNIHGFTISDDNKRIAAANAEGSIRIWDIFTAELITKLDLKRSEWQSKDIKNIFFSHDLKQALIAYIDNEEYKQNVEENFKKNNKADNAMSEDTKKHPQVFFIEELGTEYIRNIDTKRLLINSAPDHFVLLDLSTLKPKSMIELKPAPDVINFDINNVPRALKLSKYIKFFTTDSRIKYEKYEEDAILKPTAVEAWDMINGESKIIDEGESPIDFVKFGINGNQIAVARENGLVTITSISKPEKRVSFILPSNGILVSLSFGEGLSEIKGVMAPRNNNWGFKDFTLLIWKADTGKQITSIPIGSASYADVSDNGQVVNLGNFDKVSFISMGDLLSQKTKTPSFKNIHESQIRGKFNAVVSRDGRLFASSENEKIHVWQTLPLSNIIVIDKMVGSGFRTNYGHYRRGIVAFSPDGNRMAFSLGSEGMLFFYDFYSETFKEIKAHTSTVLSVAVDQKTGEFAASTGIDGTVKLWDLKTGELEREFKGKGLDDNEQFLCVTFSPDCQYLSASTLYDGTIRSWRISDGSELMPFRTNVSQDRVNSDESMPIFAYTPDGMEIVAVSISGVFRRWDTLNSSIISEFKAKTEITSEAPLYWGKGKFLSSTAFSPDTSVFAVKKNDKILMIDSKTGNVCKTIDTLNCFNSGIAFSKDGLELACNGNSSLRIFDVITGEELLVVDENIMPDQYFGSGFLAFSHDGRKLVTGNASSIFAIDNADENIRFFERRVAE